MMMMMIIAGNAKAGGNAVTGGADSRALVSVLEQLYKLRATLSSAQCQMDALREEHAAVTAECARLGEERTKQDYRIKHLVRALQTATGGDDSLSAAGATSSEVMSNGNDTAR